MSIKQVLKFEYESRANLVVHAVFSREHVDAFPDVGVFTNWLKSGLQSVTGCESNDFPVSVSNLEMADEVSKAHYHFVFYTSDAAQERLKNWCATKTNVAAYLANALKNQLAPYLGITKANAKKINGVSLKAPEIKKYSQLDYILKGGVNKLMVTGLELDEGVEFDIWSEGVCSDFYRKNCQGPKPEGGVRALFPGKTGPLAKRAEKDEGLDIDALVEHFSGQGHTPTEAEFREHVYTSYKAKSFNKQHFELVRVLVTKKIGFDRLVNPSEKILSVLAKFKPEYESWASEVSANYKGHIDSYRYQYTYLRNAYEVLNADYMQSIFRWIAQYCLVDQEVRDGQKNKALVFEGGSNCGKSAFMDIIFRNDVFGARGLTLNMKHATDGMYNSDCHLWLYRDINRGMSGDNMLRLQNIIDGDEVVREIFKAEQHCLMQPRPIVAATTTNLILSFRDNTADRRDISDRVQQFVNRLVVVQFPPSSRQTINNIPIDVSPLLKFLIFAEKLRCPKWLPFYLFWSHFYLHQDEYIEDDTALFAFDEVLSVVSDFIPIDFNDKAQQVDPNLSVCDSDIAE